MLEKHSEKTINDFERHNNKQMNCRSTKLTQNMMLNPNKKYLTQQLTSAPLKWCCFLLILSRAANAVVLIQRSANVNVKYKRNGKKFDSCIYISAEAANQRYIANHNTAPSKDAFPQSWILQFLTYKQGMKG